MGLKWGILGLGKIANHFCKDLLLIEDSDLYAVSSRSIEKANSFASRYNSEVSYGSYEAILEDPHVDIIYIATPHDSHLQYAMAAIDAGKHVLCEKPLAVNYAQVSRLTEAAQKKGVFLMEALWTRFIPVIEEVISKIKGGEIGIPTYLHSTFSFFKEIDYTSRLFNPDLAGGSILDVGLYPVFLCYTLFGMPQSIAASGIVTDRGIDLQMTALLDYGGGSAQLMSGLQTDCDMTSKIYGTEGQLIIDSRWHEAQSYQIIKPNEEIRYKHPTIGRGYAHEILECMKCIENNQLQSSKWSHQDSLNVIAILDEIRRQVGVVYPFE
jgi:predicted dehydrogenase